MADEFNQEASEEAPRSWADVVVDEPLTDEEQEVQSDHEALAEELEPGQTLPWVAEPPNGVAEERAEEAANRDEDEVADEDPQEAEGPGSEIPSSFHESRPNEDAEPADATNVEEETTTDDVKDSYPYGADGQYGEEKDDEQLNS